MSYLLLRVAALALAAGLAAAVPASAQEAQPCALEQELIANGLVDVQSLDPSIRVDLKYARPDNFMGMDVYEGLKHCYLRPQPASMLAKANALLRAKRPDLTLLVVDGTRPRRVQRRMWDIVKDTDMRPYVANPHHGSNHNRGAAVDITIANLAGERLDMGTPVDHFGILAEPRQEDRFLRQGRLTAEQVANRRLLREVMCQAGFRSLAIEWWHFDASDKQAIRSRYGLIE